MQQLDALLRARGAIGAGVFHLFHQRGHFSLQARQISGIGTGPAGIAAALGTGHGAQRYMN
ncbi:hypothetical protein [Massilia sp. DWR3-1-1]|uniref:hypothetical protein n=1 Tax=Massilia sp. DWR3-1-1 TaxID=2804559 RepID=UPI003CF6C236